MTPEDLKSMALAAKERDGKMTLLTKRGVAHPEDAPHREFLFPGHDGWDAYSYNPTEVLEWIQKQEVGA